MTGSDLRAVVLACLQSVAPEADVARLDPHQSFHDQVDLDSVDYLNFILAVEDRLGLRIAEADYPRLSSLEGSLAYLADRASDHGGDG
jgi:acyl carrier protein